MSKIAKPDDVERAFYVADAWIAELQKKARRLDDLVSSMRRDVVVGVDMGVPGSDGSTSALVEAGPKGVRLIGRIVPLWCPFCGKPHVDRGEWATRPHHKHLCHDDEHGKGCGRMFRIGESGSSEYVFGAEQLTRSFGFELTAMLDDVRERWHRLFDRQSGSRSTEQTATLFLEADAAMLTLRCEIDKRDASSQSIDARVRDFFAIAEQTPGEAPHVPSDEIVRFRLRLVAEEFLELLAASTDPPTDVAYRLTEDVRAIVDKAPIKVDLPDLADACADLDYVVAGLRVAFGIDGEPIARLVHAANMAKQGGPKREGDQKRLKPPGWKPPDIEGELRRQGWSG